MWTCNHPLRLLQIVIFLLGSFQFLYETCPYWFRMFVSLTPLFILNILWKLSLHFTCYVTLHLRVNVPFQPFPLFWIRLAFEPNGIKYHSADCRPDLLELTPVSIRLFPRLSNPFDVTSTKNPRNVKFLDQHVKEEVRPARWLVLVAEMPSYIYTHGIRAKSECYSRYPLDTTWLVGLGSVERLFTIPYFLH